MKSVCDKRLERVGAKNVLLETMNIGKFLSAMALLALVVSCKKDPPDDTPYVTTPYLFEYANYFASLKQPDENVATVEGVALGRLLFFDKRLSADNTMSCGSCHFPEHSFSDPSPTSVGIDGIFGTRNSMTLVNLAWQKRFFWDERSESLEVQALEPVPNPIELHQSWPDALDKLQADANYPTLFKQAFGSSTISKEMVAKAIAQFERSIISYNSKFDQYLRGEVALTLSEIRGFDLFESERGDCFHCHGSINTGFQFTDNIAHNNGLESIPVDSGLFLVTGNPADIAKFKTPTLRNIEFTAPYMHDGRFQTLEEVIEHYNMGGHPSPTIDPLMKASGIGRNWTAQEKEDLLNFLKTLSDPAFLTNPAFQDPY